LTPAELFPCWGMCYNHRAVERAAKQELARAQAEVNQPAARQAAFRTAGRSEVAGNVDRSAIAKNEDASRYCPVCSQRLESRRCKLICPVCGYYMSCADYY
jgi:rubrerythrin